jgi:hypothetical protein
MNLHDSRKKGDRQLLAERPSRTSLQSDSRVPWAACPPLQRGWPARNKGGQAAHGTQSQLTSSIAVRHSPFRTEGACRLLPPQIMQVWSVRNCSGTGCPHDSRRSLQQSTPRTAPVPINPTRPRLVAPENRGGTYAPMVGIRLPRKAGDAGQPLILTHVSRRAGPQARTIHRPFVVTLFMRSGPVSRPQDPINRVTTSLYE